MAPPFNIASRSPAAPQWTCRLCGHAHQPAALAPGDRALCQRCDAVLAKRGRFGADTALAFTITGLVLAAPAALLPFISVAKLNNEHVGFLSTGVSALWADDMRLLAIWVLLCAMLAPILLLGALAGLLIPPKLGRELRGARLLWRTVHALEHWAMPEVHVLAVLVALIKLGSLVHVSIGPGFWCYTALSVVTLMAWRSFDVEIAPRDENAAGQRPLQSP
jgi:paraquat-inducible protein A